MLFRSSASIGATRRAVPGAAAWGWPSRRALPTLWASACGLPSTAIRLPSRFPALWPRRATKITFERGWRRAEATEMTFERVFRDSGVLFGSPKRHFGRLGDGKVGATQALAGGAGADRRWQALAGAGRCWQAGSFGNPREGRAGQLRRRSGGVAFGHPGLGGFHEGVSGGRCRLPGSHGQRDLAGAFALGGQHGQGE